MAVSALPSPEFTGDVIEALRERLVAHNEQLSKRAERLNLGKMKGLYRRFYHTDNPGEYALRRLDEHLTKLRKAEGPFDEEHPRGDNGRFKSKGSAPRAGAFYPPTRAAHEDLKDNNYGYRQNQTAIIPETRYETFGAAAATALGVGAGAIQGAFLSNPKGDSIDRSVGRVGRFVGRRVGGVVGGVTVGGPAIAGAKALRAGIGAVNRHAGTRIPRPGPKAGREAVKLGAELGRRAGHMVGGLAARTPGQLLAIPSWAARRAIAGTLPGAKGKAVAALVGGLVGGAVPGYYAYGRTLNAGVSSIAPFLDALFPRRVEKAFGADIAALLNDPSVLAKCADMLGEDELQKALGSEIVRRAVKLIGSKVGGIVTHEATKIPRKFRLSQGGRALVGAGGSIAGSAAGAIGGGVFGAARAAYGEFNQKHPRDDHGRFAHKNVGRQIAHAAAVGAAVGAGVGLLGGAFAARRFETAMARRALATHFSPDNVQAMHSNLASRVKEKVADRFLRGGRAERDYAETLKAKAVTPAEKRAAADYSRSVQHLLRNHPGNIVGAPGAHMHDVVRATLARRAEERFNSTVARAAQTPISWITHQLDEGFDAQFKKGMAALKTPIPMHANAAGAKTNLVNNVDPDKLTPDGRKLWDELTERRTKTLDEVKGALQQRRADSGQASETLRDLKRRVDALASRRTNLEYRGAELLNDADADPAELRAFLKSEFKIDAKTSKRAPIESQVKGLKTELQSAITDFEATSKTELHDLTTDLDDARDHVNAVSSDINGDLRPAERAAIKNPFRTGTKDVFFEPMPDAAGIGILRQAAIRSDPTVRALDRVTGHHIERATKILGDTLAIQRKALERRGRAGVTDAAARWLRTATPLLAHHLDQAVHDVHNIRETLLGNREPKGFLHWVFYDRDMKKAGAWMGAQASAARAKAATTGRWAWNNKAKIVGALGLAEAIGGVSYDDKTGTRVTLNPLQWSLPRALKVEANNPDPFNPDKGIVGVTYRARDGKRRFLVGAYDDGTTVGEGKPRPRRDIAFNADLESVRERVRQGNQSQQGGGGGGQAQSVLPDDKKQEAQTAIAALRSRGQIKEGGSPDWTYSHKEGPDYGNLQAAVRSAFIENHNKRMAFPKEQRSNRPDRYFGAIRDLFEAPETALLSNQNRADILTGKDINHGLLAWDAAYGGSNKGLVKQALMREFAGSGENVHVPRGDGDKKQVFRAIHVLGSHYGLDGNDVGEIQQAVEKRMSGQPVRQPQGGQHPQRQDQPRATPETPINPKNLASELWRDNHRGAHTDEATFSALVRKTYELRLTALKEQGKSGRAAEVEALNYTENNIKGYTKSDYAVDLRKLDFWNSEASAGAKQALGMGAGDIAEGAGRRVSSGAGGGADPGTRRDKRSVLEPVRVAGGIGTYGGSAAGWEGAGRVLASRSAGRAAGTASAGAMGAMNRAARGLGAQADEKVAGRLTGAGLKSLAADGAEHVVGFGLKTAGSILGGTVGQIALEAAARGGYALLGRKAPGSFAPKMSGGEQIARTAGGILGQGAATALGPETLGASLAAQGAGGYVGENVGGWLYNHFASHYGKSTAKHMGRFFKQAAPQQAARR